MTLLVTLASIVVMVLCVQSARQRSRSWHPLAVGVLLVFVGLSRSGFWAVVDGMVAAWALTAWWGEVGERWVLDRFARRRESGRPR